MMRRLLSIVFAAIAFTAVAHAQQPPPQPDCLQPFRLTATGRSTVLQNTGSVCTYWILSYESTGFTAVSVELDAAPDNNGTPGTWAGWLYTPKLYNVDYGALNAVGFQPWVSVQLVSATGSGTVKGLLQGWRNAPSSGVLLSPLPVCNAVRQSNCRPKPF